MKYPVQFLLPGVNQKIPILPLALLLLLPAVGISLGQQYISQDGHALDANPRIGSMGINPNARLDSLMPRLNLYLTGNVRGGAGFQGFIPYRSVGEFSTGLGSDTLSGFRRDSVAIADLGRGITAGQPYFDPSRSAFLNFSHPR